MKPISRRRFIGVTAVGVAGVVLRVPAAAGAATPSDLVGQYFSDAAGTGRIGTTYLQAVPAEASEAALLAALAPSGQDPTQWWATLDLAGLQKEMRQRVHDDFGKVDVVDLSGWQLAHSEARLAALWVVTHP